MALRDFSIVILLLAMPGILFAETPQELTDANQMELETSVCGLKEPFLFWLWSSMAGSANAARLKGLHGVEDIALTTRDKRILRGYRLKSRLEKTEGYLLVLQGNAVLADQLLAEFIAYANQGYDVYIYDYRGYGRSQGKRRLTALVNDAREIILNLNTNAYSKRLVYAFSFGGILLLDGYDVDLNLDRIVVDASPARLSDYGCPKRFDPIEHLPDDSSHFLFISGRKDNVVTPAMTHDLLKQARQRGAQVIDDPDFAHPFMDPSLTNHQRRMALIQQFLLGIKPN